MSVLDRFRNRTKSVKTKSTDASVSNANMVSSYTNFETMMFYRLGSYDNTFPNISRIAEAFTETIPYAIDAKGEKMAVQPKLIERIYDPNKEMSVLDFIETLAVLAMVHPKVYVLVWHEEGREVLPGGNITPENIGGFTFLEQPRVEYRNGIKYYITRELGVERVYNEREVLEISLNVNPYAVLDGYSPSMASKKWSNVDDYVADYQAGFFKNGAVPAGQFIITARSVEDFNDIVGEMQKHHRGAIANNNVQYVHKPLSSLTGEPMPAQIEWVPFQQANNQMALQQIFDQANKKIDMAFGVPQEVKGYLQNSNYASVEVADYIFARRVIYPKLRKVWSRFTHEMNRITGGLGYALSFDYELPVLQETRKAQVSNLMEVLKAGYTLDSAVEALQLPSSFLKLAKPEETKLVEEEMSVEENNEGEDASQADTSGKNTAIVKSVKKKLIEPDANVRTTTEDYVKEQVETAIAGNKFPEKTRAKQFARRLFLALILLLDDEATETYAKGVEEAGRKGWNIINVGEFELSKESEDAYKAYLEEVALSFTQDTSKVIKEVLETAKVEKWDELQTKDALSRITGEAEWRIDRLARTETHRAMEMGKLEAMKQLQAKTSAEIYKVWNINPLTENHCETCLELNGVELPLDGSFGEFKAGEDNVADAHPNCSCFLTFVIREKNGLA